MQGFMQKELQQRRQSVDRLIKNIQKSIKTDGKTGMRYLYIDCDKNKQQTNKGEVR